MVESTKICTGKGGTRQLCRGEVTQPTIDKTLAYELVREQADLKNIREAVEKKIKSFEFAHSYPLKINKSDKMYTRQAKIWDYNLLYEFLQIADVPAKEYFIRMGLHPQWPCADMEELDCALAQVSAEGLERLFPLLTDLSPRFWRSDSWERAELLSSLESRVNYANSHYPARWQDNQERTKNLSDEKFPPEAIFEWAKLLGISPTWIFGWADGSKQLLARSAANEVFLAGYGFLSKENKSIFRQVTAGLAQQQQQEEQQL